MPHIDGPEITVKIRELFVKQQKNFTFPLKEPYICCVTAYSEENFKHKAKDSGMNQYLQKPVHPLLLEQVLRNSKVLV